MKVNKTLSLDSDIITLLDKEGSPSKVVNFILRQHFNKINYKDSDELLNEAEKENKAEAIKKSLEEYNLKRAEILDGIADPERLDKIGLEKEYREGLITGKWASYSDFADFKLKDTMPEVLKDEEDKIKGVLLNAY